MRGSRVGFATLAVLAGMLALVLAAPAAAFHTKNPSAQPGSTAGHHAFGSATDYRGFDPMEVSIPYLAWRGEEVRLVKCIRPTTEGEALGLPLADAEWQVIDWSGDEHVWPKFFDDLDQRTGSFAGRGDQGGRVCWAIDITSHKPGIAVVKMKLDSPDPTNLAGEGDPVVVHQFNVIWMTLDTPILRCLSGGDTGCPGAGPVSENPLDTNRMGVIVKGLVPLNDEFRTELGAQGLTVNANSEIRLPDAWPALARTSLNSISRALRLANDGQLDNDPVNPAGPERDLVSDQIYDEFWDIHDSTGPFNSGVYAPDQPVTVPDICPVPPPGVPSGHNASCHVTQVATAAGGDPDCDGLPTVVNDTVDNCGVHERGPFSRVFHDVSGEPGEISTIGPFSPTRPDETVLSDSLTNLNDAPMPAALVKAGIAPNTGAAADISGVGFISAVDKHLVYNRGGTPCTTDPVGSPSPHCLTAPFSGAYIPPSPTMESSPASGDDPDTASGIHGSFANDFDGYLPVEFRGNRGLYHFWEIAEIRRLLPSSPASPAPTGTPCPEFRPPSGGSVEERTQEVALYTDEHGEAQFQFNAGIRFFAGAFTRQGAGQGCLPRNILGTANLSVMARYPFQPTTNVGTTSNVVRKEIRSLFNKGIFCVPKLEGDPPTVPSDVKAFCLVKARDIAGRPLRELVCVTLIGNGSIEDFLPDPNNSGTNPPGPVDSNRVCVDTDPASPSGGDTGFTLAELEAMFGPLVGAGQLASHAVDVVLVISNGPVRVDARFIEENLNFDAAFEIPPAPGTRAASVGQSGGAVTPLIAPGGKTTEGGQIVAVGSSANGGSPSVNHPSGGGGSANAKALPKSSVLFVRIVKPLKLRAYRSVVLRVKSPQKTVRIQVKLIGKRGKVLGTLLRKVKANRTVSVPNLRLPGAVISVRVRVLA